ncbi:hypothetical protein J2W91_001472 [Paenibacillus amylolyticus]|uniref:Uncharacterized protein n=1 Tax=Paenibacillus amylolyticus TaxID=1451 RepID=A0AAP5LMU7_PAEAM|nr:hypothetical protein [Paenibacillus amylolyticus]
MVGLASLSGCSPTFSADDKRSLFNGMILIECDSAEL